MPLPDLSPQKRTGPRRDIQVRHIALPAAVVADRHHLAVVRAQAADSAAVDGGDFGLGQGACVDSGVVDELGEALVAVPVVAHGVDGFPRGPISVALEGAVVVDEGLVGGTVRYCDDVVPSARGVGNLEVPARITEIAVAVGVDADVVVAASDD